MNISAKFHQKSILIISSYSVSKLVRFWGHSVHFAIQDPWRHTVALIAKYCWSFGNHCCLPKNDEKIMYWENRLTQAYLSGFSPADVSPSQQNVHKLINLHVRIFIHKSLKITRAPGLKELQHIDKCYRLLHEKPHHIGCCKFIARI